MAEHSYLVLNGNPGMGMKPLKRCPVAFVDVISGKRVITLSDTKGIVTVTTAGTSRPVVEVADNIHVIPLDTVANDTSSVTIQNDSFTLVSYITELSAQTGVTDELRGISLDPVDPLPVAGRLITIIPAAGHTITVMHNTLSSPTSPRIITVDGMNLDLSGNDSMTLIANGAIWIEVNRNLSLSSYTARADASSDLNPIPYSAGTTITWTDIPGVSITVPLAGTYLVTLNVGLVWSANDSQGRIIGVALIVNGTADSHVLYSRETDNITKSTTANYNWLIVTTGPNQVVKAKAAIGLLATLNPPTSIILQTDTNMVITANQLSRSSVAGGGGGGSAGVNVKEDGSLTAPLALTIDFTEPDATIVSESPALEANVAMNLYALLSGRAGGQQLKIDPAKANYWYGLPAGLPGFSLDANDWFQYDITANMFGFYVASSPKFTIASDGTIYPRGNITLDAGKTVDGVDISDHASSPDEHHGEYHSILSPPHEDTVVGTLVRGDVLVVDVNGNLKKLSRGTANTFLFNNGADVLWTESGTALLRYNNNGLLTLEGDGVFPNMNLLGYGVGAAAILKLGSALGTKAAPTDTLNTNLLGAGHFLGWRDFAQRLGAKMEAKATEDWTAIAQGTKLLFYTTPNGAVAPVLALTLEDSGLATFEKNIAQVGDGVAPMVTILGYGTGLPGLLRLGGANGTKDAPTDTVTGNILGVIQNLGWRAGQRLGSKIESVAIENWAVGAQGTKLLFYTTPAGAATPLLVATLEGSGDLTLAQNIVLAAGKTIDGVDVSLLADDYVEHVTDADPHPGYTREGTLDAIAHTTVTGQWNSQAGNARKVMMADGSTGYLSAIDIGEPPQVTGFSLEPAAAGYPDDTSGLAMVASSGTDTPRFGMSYGGFPGIPSAAEINIKDETYAGNPEINPTDYPATVLTPFTSLDGPAINRGAAVGEWVSFTVTATVDGQSKTRDVAITYVNERLWGISTVDDIDTAAEIDTFRTAQSKELSNSRAKTFAVTAGAGEYIYYLIRDALGTPNFNVGGFDGGFTKVGENVSWTNPRGFVENYDVWRSINPSLGTTTVVVT